MTESTTEFIVTADAERHIRAERATVHVNISARSEDNKAAAYNAVAAVHSRLEAQARGFRDGSSGAATWHHATAPASHSVTEAWKNEGETEPRHRTVFVTSSSIEVKFQDFAAMSDWLAYLADEPLASSGSPAWALTERTRKDAESKVRTEAVRNARQYAADFAAGDDIEPSSLRLVKVDASVSTAPVHGVAGALRGSAGGSNASFAVTPKEVTVSASVTATFAATEV